MTWYYVEAGKQAGPVDDAGLEQLAQAGTIQPDTLVWREGMGDWRPLSEVKPEFAAAPPIQPAPAPALAPGTVRCVECGNTFDINDTIPYGTVRVCAACKPVFMQKLSEGVKVDAGDLRFAGFWVRFGAKFLDGLLLRIIVLPISMGLGFAIGASAPRSQVALGAANLLGGLLGMTIAFVYNVFFVGKYGATPGKMACKIKIIRADGQPVSYGRACGRFFAELLSGCFTLGIGYIMAGFDEQKRALHDRICDTRVIYK